MKYLSERTDTVASIVGAINGPGLATAGKEINSASTFSAVVAVTEAVPADKKLTVEFIGASDSSGTGAKTVCKKEISDVPALGGVVVDCSFTLSDVDETGEEASGDYPFYSVKVTTDVAALNGSVVLMGYGLTHIG